MTAQVVNAIFSTLNPFFSFGGGVGGHLCFKKAFHYYYDIVVIIVLENMLDSFIFLVQGIHLCQICTVLFVLFKSIYCQSFVSFALKVYYTWQACGHTPQRTPDVTLSSF